MTDELRATIVNLTTDIRQTVADACAAMNHAAAQLKAADTPTSPEHIAAILARLDALERRVAGMTEPKIDYESLAEHINYDDFADYLDNAEIASNVCVSDIASEIDLDDSIEDKVREMLRSI